MNLDAIRKRLTALKAQLEPETCFCLVTLSDGTEAEKTVDEWFEHRHEWQWKRMTRGGDAAAVQLVLAAWDEAAAERCMQKGDVDGAAQMTKEAAARITQYERRATG